MQTLSGQRLLLGVASGDRPSEYPIMGVDFQRRGDGFRQAVAVLRGEQDDRLGRGMKLLPEAPQPPLLVAGLAQQSPAWVGEQMQGWLAYPGTPADHVKRAGLWRKVAGAKPYISFIHLDLVDNPDAPIRRHRFGVSTGVKGLIQELESMQTAGVDHIGLHFRRNQRPLEETLEQIGQSVLPLFHN